jgi:hypothetical protein
MAVSLAVGIALDGTHPSDAVIHHFQVANSRMTSGQRTTFKDRTTAPRMSVNACLFGDFDGANRDVYARDPFDPTISVAAETTKAAAEGSSPLQPTRVAVFQQNGSGSPAFNDAFFLDNMSLLVSGILWEFSPDGTTWYAMKDVMNEARSRFVFPWPTANIYVRATGNSIDDWIHSYMVSPVFNEGYLPPPVG